MAEDSAAPEDSEVEAPVGGPDLEYDLAHDQVAGAGAGGPEPAAGRRPDQVYVPTETTDYDGDYGYDLAHDVPNR